ncbi:MAG: type II toxin-antitoxin system Phd/YefM family antitoxin [Spirochaetaceae bacterium]|nr:type II toxin-antitoxin system Phd/YefM family antitoxin [Spirochaetaceae bacterium]
MKTLQSAKAHFSSVLKDVEAGNEIAITYGKKKQTIAVIVPYENMNQRTALVHLKSRLDCFHLFSQVSQ